MNDDRKLELIEIATRYRRRAELDIGTPPAKVWMTASREILNLVDNPLEWKYNVDETVEENVELVNALLRAQDREIEDLKRTLKYYRDREEREKNA